MSKAAIDELKRIRSILSGITGLEDDDQEYIEDARKSVDRIIEALAEQTAQQQMPVAWIDPKHLEWLAQSPDNLTGAGLAARQRSADMVPLYTSPPAQPQQASDPDECASDVFEHGTSLGLFDMPKEDAEKYCKAETERTGYKHDWHYIGGRVHVKALITPQPAQQQEPVAHRMHELPAGMARYKCACCGDPFLARVADRKRGWAKFCSKSCKAIKQEKRTGQYAAYLSRRDSGLCHPSFEDGEVQ